MILSVILKLGFLFRTSRIEKLYAVRVYLNCLFMIYELKSLEVASCGIINSCFTIELFSFAIRYLLYFNRFSIITFWPE